MLRTDSIRWETVSSVQDVGEKDHLSTGWTPARGGWRRLVLHRWESSPRAHRLSRLQIYKLKIINNSNQAVINLRSLSMNPDSIS